VTDERLAEAARLREEGELERARELLLVLRAERPDDAQVAVQTAWVHDSLGLEDDAVSHYEAAIAGDLSDEDLRGAFLGYGSTLRAMGRDQDSDRVLRQGMERFPEELLRVLVETTSDPAIQRYRRSLTGYAEDLDRSWLDD
jgi:tetratricopeptide (TPR) repeat protein